VSQPLFEAHTSGALPFEPPYSVGETLRLPHIHLSRNADVTLV